MEVLIKNSLGSTKEQALQRPMFFLIAAVFQECDFFCFDLSKGLGGWKTWHSIWISLIALVTQPALN